MQLDEQVFKSNDIRGTYPDQVNEQFVYMLGRAVVQALGSRRVAVGHDSRLSSAPLCAALTEGVRSAGADVAMLGLCAVELAYYLMGSDPSFDVAVVVTASHNPPNFNGFKLVGRGVDPISERGGLGTVRRWLLEADAIPFPAADVKPPQKSVFPENSYLEHALSVAGVPDAGNLKVVVDPGNGTGGLLWNGLDRALGIEPIRMNFEPDGRFPAHDPNPALLENLLPLRDRVVAERADIGFAYDGDADRTVAVLADGHIMDGSEMILALFEHLFAGDPRACCAVSMVTSRKVLDFMRARGGEPLIVPVGHAKVKRVLRSDPRIRFAGEQSGHYFYREFHCSESSLITTLHLLHMAAGGRLQPLVASLPGPWVAPAREPTFHFDREEDALAACRSMARKAVEVFPDPLEIMCERDWQVVRRCPPADIEQAQAIRVDYPGWWFCIRPSATEPLVRLAAEAQMGQALRQKLEALSQLFRTARSA